jgi:hypothetical protein
VVWKLIQSLPLISSNRKTESVLRSTQAVHTDSGFKV